MHTEIRVILKQIFFLKVPRIQADPLPGFPHISIHGLVMQPLSHSQQPSHPVYLISLNATLCPCGSRTRIFLFYFDLIS